MNRNEMEALLYGLYCRDWFTDHDEGCPACFYEFRDNELQDEDTMTRLLRVYGMEYMTEMYTSMIEEEEE